MSALSALLVVVSTLALAEPSATTTTTTPDGEVVTEDASSSDDGGLTADDLTIVRVGEDLATSTTIALVSSVVGTLGGFLAGGLVAAPAIAVLALFLSQPLGPGQFALVTLLAAASFVPALLLLLLAPAVGVFVQVAVISASIFVTHGRDESASALALGTGFPAGGVTIFALLAAGVVGLWAVNSIATFVGTPPALAELPPVVSFGLLAAGVGAVGGLLLLGGSAAGAGIGVAIAWPDEEDVKRSVDEDDPRSSLEEPRGDVWQ